MKALVVYGTRYGSTAKIAEEMGSALGDEGLDMSVVNAAKERISDVSAFDVVIVGSGIKMGQWTKETLDFMKEFETDLSRKKVALFASCGYSREPNKVEGAREDFLLKVAERYPSIKPVSLGLFGGVFSFGKYGFAEKLLFRGIRKDLERQGVDTSRPYDFRDWDDIRQWTRAVARAPISGSDNS